MAKIINVEVLNLHYRYPPGMDIVCAEGATGVRVTSLIRVVTDEDVVGIGSAYSHPDLVRLIVEDHLRPFLIGENPADIDALWDRMYSLTRWYGRKGVAISALGAIDIALWDIRGKLACKPVYELLGGSSPYVDAYASGLLWQDDLSQLRADAAAQVAAGFKLMKMRLGRGLGYDRAAIEAVGDVISGKARVAVDGTHRYSSETALTLGRLLRDWDVAWFEEPFPPEDIDAYAKLRTQIDVPIAAGENEFGLQGFRELIRASAIDIAQPDASRAGGITECCRIAELAGEVGIPIATHSWSDAVAVVANAHVVAASKNGLAVEIDRTGTPFMGDILVEGLDISNGRLRLPNRPGLGIELDSDVVAALALPRGTKVPDGNYADMVFGPERYVAVPPRAAQEYSP